MRRMVIRVFYSASLSSFRQLINKDNVIGLVGETRALRTNRIWSKGHVENTKLPETSVKSVLLYVDICHG